MKILEIPHMKENKEGEPRGESKEWMEGWQDGLCEF